MIKLTPSDVFILTGIILTGIGLHLIYPTATPWFILILGLTLCALWGFGLARRTRKR